MSDSDISNNEKENKLITYAGIDDKKFIQAKKAKQQRDWLKKNSINVVCECGKVIKKYYISRHRKSELHKRNIKPTHSLELKISNLIERIEKLEEEIQKPII